METTTAENKVEYEIKEGGQRMNLFIIIIVLFMCTGLGLNWTLLYLLKFKANNIGFEKEMQLALSTAIINLVFTVVLVFGIFIVWRYNRWEFVSYVDRVTYVIWLVLTLTTFISTIMNFWTFSKLSGTITTGDLNDAKNGALWGSTVFTAGVLITIVVYAIRGYRAQVDNGLFHRSIRAMREARLNNAMEKY
tara:strand:- start:277 stop:852 length:576 start_codon:yes stop_codon:yes gene_type:complete